MNEKELCAICGQEHDVADMTETCEGWVCQECRDEHYTQCEHCGEWVRETNEVTIRRLTWYQSGLTEEWCPYCTAELAYRCQHCERYFSGCLVQEDNYGTVVCTVCYDDHYRTCEDCGRIIHEADACYDDNDDDYPYCDSCWNRRGANAIRNYGYKPTPEFAYRRNENPDATLTFGVELEVDNGDNAGATARQVCDDAQGRVYCKRDGSLSRGFEIVTHPASLGYHLYDFRWANLMRTCKKAGFKSHETETCGLHIHVGMDKLGSTRLEQELCSYRLVLLAYVLKDELTKFSRRKTGNLEHWAPFPNVDTTCCTSDRQYEEAAYRAACDSRYAAVNIQNYSTVEFRIFRGTLKRDTLCASLQLVSNLCKYAMTHTAKECLNATFVDIVNVEPTSLLLDYCQSRRLTVRTAA